MQCRFIFKLKITRFKMGRRIGQVVHNGELCDKVIDEEYHMIITLPPTTDEGLNKILGEKVEFQREIYKIS